MPQPPSAVQHLLPFPFVSRKKNISVECHAKDDKRQKGKNLGLGVKGKGKTD